jgi:hypothetical protein
MDRLAQPLKRYRGRQRIDDPMDKGTKGHGYETKNKKHHQSYTLKRDRAADDPEGRISTSEEYETNRFIVLPAPLAFSSVNLAQFSSFSRFWSSAIVAERVPSCSDAS